jgi:hypothetical protein
MNFIKSKTMNFAMVLGLLGLAQANLPALQAVISPGAYGYITMAIGVAVAVLRVVTTQPLSEK